jgi:hypothetical protein
MSVGLLDWPKSRHGPSAVPAATLLLATPRNFAPSPLPQGGCNEEMAVPSLTPQQEHCQTHILERMPSWGRAERPRGSNPAALPARRCCCSAHRRACTLRSCLPRESPIVSPRCHGIGTARDHLPGCCRTVFNKHCDTRTMQSSPLRSRCGMCPRSAPSKPAPTPVRPWFCAPHSNLAQDCSTHGGQPLDLLHS